jgi:hypothetical protein
MVMLSDGARITLIGVSSINSSFFTTHQRPRPFLTGRTA